MPKLLQRYMPPGATEYKRYPGGAVAFTYETATKFAAIGWKSDRAIKHEFHYAWNTPTARETFLTNWKEGKEALAKHAEKIDAIKKRPNPYKIGDIIHYSWGHEQTNNDFYQVVEVKGKSVVLRKIKKRTVQNNEFMSAYVMPQRDEFVTGKEGLPFVKHVRWYDDGKDGSCGIKFDYSGGKLWDGEKAYESYYA